MEKTMNHLKRNKLKNDYHPIGWQSFRNRNELIGNPFVAAIIKYHIFHNTWSREVKYDTTCSRIHMK